MKKSICIVTIVSVLAAFISAETNFGITSRIGDSSWRGSDWEASIKGTDISNELSLSLSFGLFTEFEITKSVSIQTDFLLTTASMKYGDGDNWITETWQYFELPAVLKKYFAGTNRPYIAFGPSIGYLLTDPDIELSNGVEGSYEADENVLIGYSARVGIETPKGFIVGINYSQEFTEILDDIDWFVYGVSLELGWEF